MLLRVELAPSRLLSAGVVMSYLLALASLMFSDIPAWASCSLALGIFINFQYANFTGKRPVALSIADEMVWLYFSDHQINVVLEGECYCTQWVQILHFRECYNQSILTKPSTASHLLADPRLRPISPPRLGSARYSVILLPDSCSSNARRRLAVILRWHRFMRVFQLL